MAMRKVNETGFSRGFAARMQPKRSEVFLSPAREKKLSDNVTQGRSLHNNTKI